MMADDETLQLSAVEQTKITAFVLGHFTPPHGWYESQRELAEHFVAALAREWIPQDALRPYDADQHSWIGIAPGDLSVNSIGFGVAEPWPGAVGAYVRCQIHDWPQWQGVWYMRLDMNGTLEVYKDGLPYAGGVAAPVSFIYTLLVRAVAP